MLRMVNKMISFSPYFLIYVSSLDEKIYHFDSLFGSSVRISSKDDFLKAKVFRELCRHDSKL